MILAVRMLASLAEQRGKPSHSEVLYRLEFPASEGNSLNRPRLHGALIAETKVAA